MAHNLHVSSLGQTSMFYNSQRGKPWHKLGQAVDGAATWEEAMKAALLDWTAVKRQLLDPVSGLPVEAWGTFREDTGAFLGAVGSAYEVIQNRQAFDFVDTLLEADNGAHYESAGALGNGSQVWCLAQVPHSFKIDGTDDRHDTYVMFATAHDGTQSATCKLTTVRVVCQNTLNAALTGQGAALRIRHSKNAVDRLDHAKKLITGVSTTAIILSEKLNELARRRVDKTMCRDLMNKVFGEDWQDSTKKKNQAREIAQLFESNDRNAIPEIKGTAYNLLNACTEWSDHFRSVRTTDSRAGMSPDTIRKAGSLFEYDNWKDKVLDEIIEITATAPRREPVTVYPSAAIPAPSRAASILEMMTV